NTKLPNASVSRGARGSFASVTDQSRMALIASPRTAEPMLASLFVNMNYVDAEHAENAEHAERTEPRRLTLCVRMHDNRGVAKAGIMPDLCNICNKYGISRQITATLCMMTQSPCTDCTSGMSVGVRPIPAQQCEKF